MPLIFLALILILSGCGRGAPVPSPQPETFEAMLLRTKGVTCAEITNHDEGTTPPSCQRIYRYHLKALDLLYQTQFSIPVECLNNVRMNNVRYVKKLPVDPATAILPPIGSVLPVIEYTYQWGLR